MDIEKMMALRKKQSYVQGILYGIEQLETELSLVLEEDVQSEVTGEADALGGSYAFVLDRIEEQIAELLEEGKKDNG